MPCVKPFQIFPPLGNRFSLRGERPPRVPNGLKLGEPEPKVKWPWETSFGIKVKVPLFFGLPPPVFGPSLWFYPYLCDAPFCFLLTYAQLYWPLTFGLP